MKMVLETPPADTETGEQAAVVLSLARLGVLLSSLPLANVCWLIEVDDGLMAAASTVGLETMRSAGAIPSAHPVRPPVAPVILPMAVQTAHAALRRMPHSA